MQDGSFEPEKKTGNAEVQRMSFEGHRTSYVDETLRLLKERREELRAQLATKIAAVAIATAASSASLRSMGDCGSSNRYRPCAVARASK